MDDTGARERIHEQLRGYIQRYPEEAETVNEFFSLMDTWPDALYRTHFPGHLTASAWVVARNHGEVLLLHHKKLGKWLQPGGHVDGNPDLPAAALREVWEETGLTGLSVEPEVFDIDIHTIPPYRDIAEHKHFDVRFLVVLEQSCDLTGNDESHAVKWQPIGKIEELTTEESIRRMARKSYSVFSVSGFRSTV